MKSWKKKRKRKQGRATRQPRKSMSRHKRTTVTAAMLETLKEKQPRQTTRPMSLPERLLAYMRRFKGSAPMSEDTVIYVVNAMLVERGLNKMSPDVEDLFRVAYQNA